MFAQPPALLLMLQKLLLFFLFFSINASVIAQRFTCDTFTVSIEIQQYTCDIKGYVSAVGNNVERQPFTYQLGLEGEVQTSGAFISLEPLVDSLYVTDRRGCLGVFPVEVEDLCQQQELKINNSVTPNGDGIDDKWYISGWEKYPDIEISLYNQQGIRIYHSFDYSVEWDGTVFNVPAAEGAYFYLIKLDRFSGDKEMTKSGSLTLIR